LHANAVLSEEVLDYSVLLAEIVDAFFDPEIYAEAEPIYELLDGDPIVCQITIVNIHYLINWTSSNSSMLEKCRRVR
jgi:general transcription factor 3C polypeptide 3 (transcription factor C subunit 4)